MNNNTRATKIIDMALAVQRCKDTGNPTDNDESETESLGLEHSSDDYKPDTESASSDEEVPTKKMKGKQKICRSTVLGKKDNDTTVRIEDSAHGNIAQEYPSASSNQGAVLDLRRNKRGRPISLEISRIPPTYSAPIPINTGKNTDLLSLLPLIDPAYHGFHQSFTTSERQTCIGPDRYSEDDDED
ncbi:hypothetical protein PR048_028626 [Dryococelus australis]|uniref:Uncharacterized protein n=1 Tax=Dryococelus australis TaxID=614101 RepID=A0ABQ9GB35_9NEOP|nr:hypothetical protein PR048_028626 [Dryococelus australis]